MLTRIIYNNNIVATGVIHILRFDRRKRVRTTVYYYNSITRNRRRRRADVRLLLLLCIRFGCIRFSKCEQCTTDVVARLYYV